MAEESAAAASVQHSEEIAPAPLVTSPYRILIPDTGKTFKLYYGANTIGRCTPDLVDPTFISIDNANVALSRLHASITVAPNNDGWIRDLGSTNGTVVAVREGEGVTLEKQCFYQLNHGAVITLGDLPVLYVDSQIVPDREGDDGAAATTSGYGDDAVPRPSSSNGALSNASAAAPSPHADGISSSTNEGGPQAPELGRKSASAARRSFGGPNFTIESEAGLNPASSSHAAPSGTVNQRPYLDDDSDTSLPLPPTTASAVPNDSTITKDPASKGSLTAASQAAVAEAVAAVAAKKPQPLSFMDDEDDLPPPATHTKPITVTNSMDNATAADLKSPSSARKSGTLKGASAAVPPAAQGEEGAVAASPKNSKKQTTAATESAAASPKAAAGKKTPAAKRGRKGADEEDEGDAAGDDGKATKKTRAEAPAAAAKGKKAAPPAVTTPTAAAPPPASAAQRAPTLSEYRSRLPDYAWPEAQKLTVCLSGMDTTDRERVSNRIRLMGGTVLEEWSDRATLLVVKDSPAARTPKFLIALAKGVIVVTSRFFTDQQAGGSLSRLLEFVPDLQHGGTVVPASDIVDVVVYNQQMKAMGLSTAGALSGTVFTINDVPAKAKGTVGDVISGAGGKVAKTKRDEAKALAANMRHVTLAADDVEKLYDAIVTGTASRFML